MNNEEQFDGNYLKTTVVRLLTATLKETQSRTVLLVDVNTIKVSIDRHEIVLSITKDEKLGIYVLVCSIEAKFCGNQERYYERRVETDEQLIVKWLEDILKRVPSVLYSKSKEQVEKWVEHITESCKDVAGIAVKTVMSCVELEVSPVYFRTRSAALTPIITVPIRWLHDYIQNAKLELIPGTTTYELKQTQVKNGLIVICAWNNKDTYKFAFSENYKSDACVGQVLSIFLLCMLNRKRFPYNFEITCDDHMKEIQGFVL
jgi:hypothetical protein